VDQHSLKRCALGAADLLVFEAEQICLRANPPTYAVNMPLPPPRIGPRTIIAVDGGIDLPSGNADTDPGQIHTPQEGGSSRRGEQARACWVESLFRHL
jgi:hypothetical protein